MTEKEVIEQTPAPVTVGRIVEDVRSLGVREGDCLLVHSSLSALGWMCGGPQAVVQALMEAVGVEGTLVMPAHSGDWSDPARWEHPPVPDEWVKTIYREMPAYDPLLTPTRGMGRIAELFRTFPGTVRSSHPQTSFCANGRLAERIVSGHALTPQFGMESPLGKLYRLGAKVLLLGVGYDSCTSFHLAEASTADMPKEEMGAAMMYNGERAWRWFTDFAYDSEDFGELGEAFERAGRAVQTGAVGNAASKLFHMAESVEFAKGWLNRHRYHR